MTGPLRPPVSDRRPSAFEQEARAAAEELHQASRRLEPTCDLVIADCREALDALKTLLQVPFSSSDLDPTADTAWAAVWQMSARSLTLTYGMVALAEAGLGRSLDPVARTVHEANRLLQAFVDPDESDLLRAWLAGCHVKPATVRKALRRGDQRHSARTDQPEESAGAAEAARVEIDLYGLLSEGAHLQRDSTQLAASATRRTLDIGPETD